MIPRLSDPTLAALPGDVRRPAFDRARVERGIVHLGPGAFHRVHQAWYAQRWLEADPRWGICAVAPRSDALRTALRDQDWLYTLAILDLEVSYEVIGSLREVLVAAQSPAAAAAAIARPETRMVTMTVTEKGYCLDVDGRLDVAHPDVAHDRAHPRVPRSAIGLLAEGLRLRRDLGLPAVPVVSCDNLPGNGRLLATAVRDLAAAADPALADWISAEVPFPCTMVDSITPATTGALRERVAGVLGLEDRWPVQRESYLQWVVEAHEAFESPDWAAAGVVITDDVSAYERAKLRLLNGAHSTLAYLGLLRGHATVAEAMSDAPLARYVRDLMQQDVVPTLGSPRGLDLPAYVESVLRRFANPAIRHDLAQIAWDGSKKLPVRLLGTVRDALGRRGPIQRPCTAVAAWMHFVRRRIADDHAVTDPLAARMAEVLHGRDGTDPGGDVDAFLGLGEVFATDLVQDPRFRRGIVRAYARLAEDSAALPT